MGHEQQLTRLFFGDAVPGPVRWRECNAVIRAAPPEEHAKLRKLLGALQVAHALALGYTAPESWELRRIRSSGRKTRGRVPPRSRGERRPVVVGKLGPAAAEAVPVAPVAAAVAVEPAPASLPAPAARPALVCPRCGSTKLVRAFARVWACERCGGQIKQALPGVAP